MKKISNIIAVALATLVLNVFAQYEEVGTLKGQLSVGGNGAAIYTLPIELPAGRGGIVPQLALQYNSSSEYGIMGKGWGFSGGSYITRTNETMYYDNKSGAIDFIDDGFSLDGQRLIMTNQSNNEYRTEVDANTRITRIGNKSITNATHWKVVTADGNTYLYGETSTSKQNNGDNTETIRWHLSSTTDLNGNKVLYEYDKKQETGEIYLTRIIYTINEGGEVNDQLYEVKLNYEPLGDAKHHITSLYANGLNHYQYSVTQLLTDISVYYKDALLNKYVINYEEGGIFSSKYVKSVALQNSSNLNIYKPTTFEWEYNDGAFLSELTKISTELSDSEYEFEQVSGDFNGDGITDIAEYGFTNPYGLLIKDELKCTFFSENNNAQAVTVFKYIPCPHTTPSKRLYVADVNCDGKDELLLNVVSSGGIDDYISIYSISVDGYLEIGTLNGNVSMTGDFNGDLLQDIIVVDDWGYYHFIAGKPSLNEFLDTENRKPIDGINGSYTIGHFTGDGKANLLKVDNGSCWVYELKGFDYNTITCDLKFSFQQPYPIINKLDIGDFNGDGKHDLIVVANDNGSLVPSIYFSYGNGFITNIIPYNDFFNRNYKVADFNNDRVDDLIFARDQGNTTNNDCSKIYYTVAYKCNGLSAGFDFYTGVNSTYISNPFNYRLTDFLIGDFTGSGENSLLFKIKSTEGIYEMIAEKTGLDKKISDKIKNVTNGLGESKFINYVTFKNARKGFFNYPIQFSESRFSVVEGFYQPVDEYGWEYTPTELYSFENLILHTQGKGLLGFQKTKVSYPAINATTETTMDVFVEEINGKKMYFFPYQNMVLSKSSGKTVATEEKKMLVRNTVSGNKFVFSPYVTYSISRAWDNDINNTYKGCVVNIINPEDVNQYGIAEVSYTYSDENNRDFPSDKWTWKTKVENKYNYGSWPNGKWFINLKQSTLTNSSDVLAGGNDVRVTDYSYKTDSPWLLESVTSTPNSSTKLALTTQYVVYDEFGNVTHEKTYPKGDPSKERVIRRVYGSQYEGRFLTKEIIEAPGDDLITTYTYNEERGLLRGKTDAQGNSTTYRYSPSDVLEKTILPDNTADVVKLYWASGMEDAPAGAVYCEYSFTEIGAKDTETTSDIQWNTVVRFFDKQGKELRTVTKNIQGLKTYTDKGYCPYTNRLLYEYKPYYSSDSRGEFTEYIYDDNGRISKIVYPEGYEEIYTYKGRSVKIENSQTKVFKETIVNAQGKPELISDPTGNMIFEYDAAGRVKKTTANGATFEFAYDEAGFQKQLNDPDAGIITFVNNAFGEVIEKTDNKGNKLISEFDQVGRLKLTYLEGTNEIIRNEYYQSITENGYGQLKTAYKHDASIDYNYDKIGRVITKTETINGKKLVTNFTYNSENGMLEQCTYPAGFAVKYKYNSRGHLEQIQRASDNTILWKGTEQNHRGQWVKHNTAVTNSTNFYDRFGFLERTLVENQKVLQDFRYQYNPVTGNLMSRADHPANEKESFTYDSQLHNRLESCSINGSLFSGVLYYDNGNIRQKSDVSMAPDSYKYQHPLGKVHAVTEIKQPTASYSSSAYEQHLVFNDLNNKVKSITKPSPNNTTLRLEFNYGPDNQLKTTSLKIGNSSALENHFYSGNYELVEYSYLTQSISYNYLYAPTGLFAVAIQGEDYNEIFYIQTDHLGSITGITDNTGTLVQRLSYDPWGRRRNPDKWTSYTVDQPMFSKGFTGHEHLDLFGLINMNARLYDPFLGRFLSPDPLVGSPDNSQSFNRYSYCLNNPLSYVDPDGETPVMLIGAIVGGGINVFNNWDKISKDPWSSLGYFASGALGGALATVPGMQTLAGTITAAGNIATDIAFGNAPDIRKPMDALIYLGNQALNAMDVAGAGKIAQSAFDFALSNGWKQSSAGVAKAAEFVDFTEAGESILQYSDAFVVTAKKTTRLKPVSSALNVTKKVVTSSADEVADVAKSGSNWLQGGKTFAQYKAARGGTSTLAKISTSTGTQRISTEFHHVFITQRMQRAYNIPNWAVNNRLNVWKLNTVQHSLIDPHRYNFLRAGFKPDVGWFGKYNWFTRF